MVEKGTRGQEMGMIDGGSGRVAPTPGGEQLQMFDATLKSILNEKALPFKKLTASRASES